MNAYDRLKEIAFNHIPLGGELDKVEVIVNLKDLDELLMSHEALMKIKEALNGQSR